MSELAQAFKTLDEDDPKYGVIFPSFTRGGRQILWYETEDMAYWAANDFNASIPDMEATER